MTLSLHSRVIVAAAAVMLLFFGVTGWTLQSIYIQDAERALEERLQSDAYALIAAAEIDDSGVLRLSYLLPDSRFLSVASNVYAQIASNDNHQLWQSASLSRLSVPFPRHLSRDQRRFERVTAADGQDVYLFSMGVAWEISARKSDEYTVGVAVGLDDFNSRIDRFRSRLWSGLGGVAVLLIVVQSLILRWGLRPLTRAAHDLVAIERGERHELGDDYPEELRALTRNINALIHNRQTLVERHRNSLGDLAHSLKTPLAVLRGIVESGRGQDAVDEQLREQIDAMTRIVSYQLQKGAAAGGAVLTTPVDVRPVADKLVATLSKVYKDKNVNCAISIAPGLQVAADEGDMMEILGNLLDNAFKWCSRRVEIAARLETSEARPRMIIEVSDDGPGIPPSLFATVVQRGARADSSIAGHGIGLAVVSELARLYQGRLQISRGPLGGACLRVELPAT